MTCDEARAAFSDLYDGILSGPPLAALDRHLEGCPACRAEWGAFLKTVQVLGEMGSGEPSPGFAARVRGRIETPPWWARVARALFVPVRLKVPIQAVAVAVLAVTAVMLYQRSPDLQRQAAVRAPSPGPPRLGARMETPSHPGEREKRDAPATGGQPNVPAGAGGTLLGPPKARPERSLHADQDRRQASRGRGDAETLPAARPAPPAVPQAQPAAPSPAAPMAPASPATDRTEARRLDQLAPPAESDKDVAALSKKEGPEPQGGSAKSLSVPGGGPAAATGRAKAAEGRIGPATAPPPSKIAEPEEGKPGQAASIPAGSADELYAAGLTEYARREYGRAAEAFRAFLAGYPRDVRAPDARFYLADSHFAARRYAEAIPEYQALIRQFPESRRVPAALLREGQARLALGDQAGCQALRDVTDRYARMREAGQARETLAERCPNEAR